MPRHCSNGKITRTLDQFTEAIMTIPDRTLVSYNTRLIGSNTDNALLENVDRHFFFASLFERDDVVGTWTRRGLEVPPPKKELVRMGWRELIRVL